MKGRSEVKNYMSISVFKGLFLIISCDNTKNTTRAAAWWRPLSRVILVINTNFTGPALITLQHAHSTFHFAENVSQARLEVPQILHTLSTQFNWFRHTMLGVFQCRF